MADILIRGMELPKNEPLRIVLNPNGQLFVDHGVTFTEYEAVELPEHGDLISREQAFQMMLDRGYQKEAAGVILEVPTVIPSKKEESE